MSQPRGGASGRGYRGRPWKGRGGYYGGKTQGHRGFYWRGRGQYASNGTRRTGNSGTQANASGRPLVQTSLYDVPSPYKAWKLYFPEEIYSSTSPVVTRVKIFEKCFEAWKTQFNFDEIESKGWFAVDFKELIAEKAVSESVPELAQEIRQTPEVVIQCMGLAMHQMISIEMSKKSPEEDGNDLPAPEDPTQSQASTHFTGSTHGQERGAVTSQHPSYVLPIIHCRLLNFDPVTPLKNLKANYYGKFVSVKGTVVRVSNIKPLCTQMVFECSACSHNQVVKFSDGKYTPPTQCTAVECRSKLFSAKRSHNQTITIDWQTIRIQEIMNDDQRESGRIPRTVDCELTNDLVDSCVPGDNITASGTVKVLSSTEDTRRKAKDKCMFLLYIHANSVTNCKGGGKNADGGGSGINVDFTMKDLYAIEEIQAQEGLFRLLVASVCPAIYGHEMVKAGLVLALFGGTPKYANDKNRIPVRGDPHILVVGDPGLGKSQMLQAMANIAPRSVYVCGNTTTTSGLTVTLTKEGGGGGDYALEAGALVLADQGCCCIDEFDKMGAQHQALLEAMEQQSISIAKAGIVCSLPARTSILAAANPVGGHYNKAKTVSENLRMGGALLSRFDLVFILLDKPDEEMDALLSDHVMALHAGKKRSSGETPRLNDSMATEDEIEARRQYEAQKPLSERLRVPSGEVLDVISAQLLRKYVAYARKYVQPRITAECAQMLQQFYLDLRKRHQSKDCTPITTRQLESLIRLTEARARLELREECSAQDAHDVIEVMQHSMVDTYADGRGMLDFSRSQHGSGMSTRGAAKKMIAALQRAYERTLSAMFTVQDMRDIAQEARIQVLDFEGFVASLNNQGYLLKKGPRLYQLQTAGY